MSTLPGPTDISYNGVTFNDPSTETVGIDAKPIPDAAGRTVTCVEYTITLKAVIAANNQALSTTTDSLLLECRRRLTAYGGAFVYKNEGYGDLSINVPGVANGAWDADWGPKPQLLKWKQLGHDQAAEIEWTVVLRVPECPMAKFTFALMECNYRLKIAIDRAGVTTRTYSGYLKIPQTRKAQSDRTIQHTADEFREKINPVLLPGFRRVYGPFDIDYSKNRLDWSIEDQETGIDGNYLPPGVVDATADETLESTGFGAYGSRWNGTISATYEMAPGWSQVLAWRYFCNLVNARLNAIRNGVFRGNLNFAVPFPAAKGIGTVLVLTHATVAETDIYGRPKAHFSAGFTFLSTLDELLDNTGLFKPVAGSQKVVGSNWSEWAKSLSQTAFNIRGNAQLKALASDDAIIDLCQPPLTTALKTQPKSGSSIRTSSTNGLEQTPPPEATSWLIYISTVRYEDDDETVELKTLPLSKPKPNPFPDDNLDSNPAFITSVGGGSTLTTTGGGTLDAADFWPAADTYIGSKLDTGGDGNQRQQPVVGGSGTQPPSTAKISSVQIRNRPSFYVILEGIARRVGFPTTPPRLKSVGGVPAVLANRMDIEYTKHGIVASWFGLQVYESSWRQRYLIPGVPGGSSGLFVPGNPLSST